MKEFLQHYFLPHYTNNQRARLLHHQSVFVIASFLVISTLVFSFLHKTYPAVLGTTIDISSQQLLLLTNKKRLEAGVQPLVMNDALVSAARAKEHYMFTKNFWSHIAPDGTTPWAFIKNSGYQYVYAGENLARGFTTPSDVIDAWMASPEHRDNMLSPNYTDVGFAMGEGDLTGEKDTTLVVEMLGSTTATAAIDSHNFIENQKRIQTQVSADSIIHTSLINQIQWSQFIALTVIGVFLIIFLLDIIVVKHKNIVRIFEHNIDHVLFFLALFGVVLLLARGTVY